LKFAIKIIFAVNIKLKKTEIISIYNYFIQNK
jgi:hypothetical protein